MVQKARLSFSIQPFEGVFTIVPVLDGTPLTEMILSFESEKHFEPAGGYGGLIPQWFKYGSLNRYFLGDFDQDSYFARLGYVYLLGCKCGEVGCWPFGARIKPGLESVVWDSFRQPHRPERDYSDFGPIVFEADEYQQAVAGLDMEFCVRLPHAE
jgi:hypothetical protein